MDHQLYTRVLNVINKFLSTDELFTILDVTKAVKNDGYGYGVTYHSDIRNIAKPILDTLVVGRGYTITSISVTDVNGMTVNANLYHPDARNESEYTNRGQPATVVSKPQPTTKSQAHIVPVVTKGITSARLNKTVGVRKDGSVEVPAVAMMESGLLGQGVEVVNHPNSVSIVHAQSASRDLVGGFRVSAKTLANSNLSNKTSINVAVFKDKIVISG